MDSTRQVILVRVESAYNVIPTFSPQDSVLVENFKFTRSNLKMVERNPIEASKATRQKIYAGSLVDITFEMELKGSGVLDQPPEASAPFLGCGIKQVAVAGFSTTYSPLSDNQASIGFERFVDGKRQRFTGCRGSNCTMTFKTHGKPMVSFSFTGHFESEIDTPLSSTLYDNTVPPPVIAGNFVYSGSTAEVIDTLTLSIANKLNIPTNMNAVDGFGEVSLGKREITGSIDPEDSLVAVQNWRARMEAGTLASMSLGPIGFGVHQEMNLSLIATYITSDDEDVREDKVIRTISFDVKPFGTDDDFTLVFS